MSHSNTVAIISNVEFVTQEIKNMLVLLREVDSVDCCDFFDAEDYIKKQIPGVIILHAAENDQNALKLLKKIRTNDNTKNTPVILYPEYSNADFTVEAFDLGVTDILSSPLKDYELVIRVIWAIQKNEKRIIEKTGLNFLAKLGIINDETGFYREEFSIKYLESVVEQAKRNRQNACLILLKARPAVSVSANKDYLINALKTSVRLSDTIAAKDEDSYYIFLSRSKLNGVYSVYERLVSKLGPMTAICACAVEIKDEFFDDTINVLDRTILTAPENGEIVIVRSKDFSDLYASQNKSADEKLEISKILDKRPPKTELAEIISDEQEIEELCADVKLPDVDDIGLLDDMQEDLSQISNDEINQDDKIALGIEILNKKVEKIGGKPKKTPPLKPLKPKNKLTAGENNDMDKRNQILYKQSWAKKIELVVRPLLKKYAAKFQSEFKMLDANLNITPRIAFLKLEKNDILLNFEVSYDDVKTLTFNLSIVALGSKIESDKFEMEVMELDYQKLDIILGTLAKEYKNYLSED